MLRLRYFIFSLLIDNSCSRNGPAFKSSGWSKWTHWTKCSITCGAKGTQWRVRSCTSDRVQSDCLGPNTEVGKKYVRLRLDNANNCDVVSSFEKESRDSYINKKCIILNTCTKL